MTLSTKQAKDVLFNTENIEAKTLKKSRRDKPEVPKQKVPEVVVCSLHFGAIKFGRDYYLPKSPQSKISKVVKNAFSLDPDFSMESVREHVKSVCSKPPFNINCEAPRFSILTTREASTIDITHNKKSITSYQCVPIEDVIGKCENLQQLKVVVVDTAEPTEVSCSSLLLLRLCCLKRFCSF
jgi:hypothetical protein